MKILIGTANFGLNYGITNSFKRLSKSAIQMIISERRGLGFEGFDTAQGYGEAESTLGELVEWSQADFVTTKFNQARSRKAEAIVESAKSSIRSLKITPRILFFHSIKFLREFSSHDVIRAQESLLEQGLKVHLGASVYRVEEALEVNSQYPTLAIFQLPLNVTMLGGQQEDLLFKAKDQGIHFFARSIFLQGILGLAPSDPRLAILNPEEIKVHKKVHEIAIQNSVKATQLSLMYVEQVLHLDGAVLGIETVDQLREISCFRNNMKTLALPKRLTTQDGLFDLREKRFNNSYR